MKLLRFISNDEYNMLKQTGTVKPIKSDRAWAGKNRLYFFPLDTYNEEEFWKVKEYLEVAYDITYDLAIYLNIDRYAYTTFAAYDVDMMNMALGKELSFDVDEDSYDSGDVYVVPEVRLDYYTVEEVYEIEVLNY